MKTVLFILGFVFIALAALATPIAIGLGIYDWAVGGMEFKLALWEGFKSWVLMIVIGLGVGLTSFLVADIK